MFRGCLLNKTQFIFGEGLLNLKQLQELKIKLEGVEIENNINLFQWLNSL